MISLFQKISSYFKFKPPNPVSISNSKKKKKYRRKKSFMPINKYTSVSYANSSSTSKSNACLLLFILYVIIGIILYQLIK